MENFTKVPNIGAVLAEKLVQVDIKSVKDLKNLGSEKAFTRISAVDSSACINMLYALEGAVQGIRWHQLPAGRKEELKQFFHQLNNKNHQ